MFNKKKNIRNVFGGRKAKSNGDYFETILSVKCAKEKISFIKIPSGCRWIRSRMGVKPIPTKTPFDFILCKNGKSVFFDAKCVSTNSFSFSQIKEHQLNKLFEIEQQKFLSGYIVHYKKENKIVFFTSSTLKNLPARHSLKSSAGVFLGSTDNFSLIPLMLLEVQ